MKYFILDEQDDDWKPVMKNFTSDMLLDGYLDTRHRHIMGAGIVTFELTSKAMTEGFDDPKQLFQKWYDDKQKETKPEWM